MDTDLKEIDVKSMTNDELLALMEKETLPTGGYSPLGKAAAKEYYRRKAEAGEII